MNEIEWAAKWAREHENELRSALPALSEEDALLLAALHPGLAREDVGWATLGPGGQGHSQYDLTPENRRHFATSVRPLVHVQAHARRILELWQSFLVGEGLSYHVADNASWNKRLVDLTRAFSSRNYFSRLGQRNALGRNLVDGETFHLVDRGEIRHLDPLSIDAIVTDEEDPEVIGWVTATRWFGDKLEKICWRSWDQLFRAAARDVPQPEGFTVKPGYVVHFVWSPLATRGISYFAPALPWISRVRSYLNSRVGVMAALHRIALRVSSSNGDHVGASRALAALQSSVSGDNVSEYNPPPGGAAIVNATGLDFKDSKFDTGAAGAAVDLNTMLGAMGAGAGTPASYLGGEGAANLASAASVELPTMATYQHMGGLFAQFYEELTKTALATKHGSADVVWNLDLEVAIPKIERRNQPGFIASIASILGQVPELKQSPEFLRVLMHVLGTDDADDAADALGKAVKEAEEKAEAAAEKIAAQGPVGPDGAPRSDRGAPRPERSPVEPNARSRPDGGPDGE